MTTIGLRAAFAVALLLVPGMATRAQYAAFEPKGSFAVEVSLENSPLPRLPIYRNAITSLAVVGDHVIGGTSASGGKSPFVFAVSLARRRLEQMRDLAEVVPGQRAIVSGFGRQDDGALCAGTLPERVGDDGHLIELRLAADALTMRDLGVPAPGEGVFAVTVANGHVYGITHPSGRFFSYRLQDRAIRVFPETAPSPEELGELQPFVLEPADYLSRRLAVDGQGRVWGSRPVNRLFRFDPATDRIEILKEALPAAWSKQALGRVDSWARGPDGMLYGGSAADGQLFRVDPTNGAVTNLGKPIGLPRMKGLAFAADGLLYGVAGGPPGYTRLFTYDLRGHGFRDLGIARFRMLEPGMEKDIPWRAFNVGTVAASEDGSWVVLGEEEALSQLLAFPVRAR
jgi:hypothetical protein